MVLEGGGWLDVEALDGPIEMGPGDLAVLPTGSPHWMRDAPGSTAPPLTAILASHDVVDGELRFGTDDGPLTEVVCGLFSFEEGHHASWIDGLPPVVTSARGWDGGGWRSPVIEALSHEARRPTPGGSLIVNRLLETLIADALRAELAAALADGGAPTAALADARIGRALLRMHDQPSEPWTVRALANAAMMSRSAFSARFRALVGQAPMRYLTEVRLRRAARLLRSSDATLAEVARSVGYGSEDALSRAFKGRFGEAPSAFRSRRRNHRSTSEAI
jgi:AraC-like DNA-binding protein